jgi:hypothetical protein
MPSLTGTWTQPDGAILAVRIGITGPEQQLLRAANHPIPQPVETTALLDTGAEVTCVDPAVFARLSLPFLNVTPVNMRAGGGLFGSAQYAGSLVLPHPSGKRRDDFEVEYLSLTEVDLGVLGYDVLIGRDVLARCVFRFDGPGLAFTLDY